MKEKPERRNRRLFSRSVFPGLFLGLVILVWPVRADQPGEPHSTVPGSYVAHGAYSLQYNEDYEQPDWVAYELTAEELEPRVPRKNRFRADPDVVTKSASSGAYKGSGFDRGHLAPAADMRFSREAMAESFYMSNMCPQAPGLNRGIWKRLEEKVRFWARREGVLWIVAGPLWGESPRRLESGVAVPSGFFKVVADFRGPNPKTIGFVFPNQGSSEHLSDFAVTVDRVERISGFDFFPDLPDSLEETLESSVDYDLWEDS